MASSSSWTMLPGRCYLPPDPNLSAEPVVTNAAVTRPAENHAILLEDEPSFCLREGKVWRLKEVDLKEGKGMISAHRESKESGADKEEEQQMTIDAATRFWRGRERHGLEVFHESSLRRAGR